MRASQPISFYLSKRSGSFHAEKDCFRSELDGKEGSFFSFEFFALFYVFEFVQIFLECYHVADGLDEVDWHAH